MMDIGFIIISRSITDSAVFQNEKWLRVWIWCLLEASYKQRTKSVKTGKGFTTVNIERGQFIFGRNKHAKDLNMSPSTLWKIMLKLKNLGNLDIQSDKHYSIITICNYNQYQNIENYKVTTKVTTKEQPSDNQGTHLNKGKKEKKVNNKDAEKPNDVTYQTWEDWKKHRKNKKAIITENVINGFRKQSTIAGLTLEDAIKKSIERGWTGFDASWLSRNKKEQSANQYLDKQREETRRLLKND